MQQLSLWPGKLILCKKTPQNRLFWWTQNWFTWLWKDLDAKLLTPGQLVGCPWKLWGTKIERTRTRYILFSVCAQKFAKKWFFWVKRYVPKNFRQENFSGLLPTESLRTQDSENVISLGDRASVSKLQQFIMVLWSKTKFSERYFFWGHPVYLQGILTKIWPKSFWLGYNFFVLPCNWYKTYLHFHHLRSHILLKAQCWMLCGTFLESACTPLSRTFVLFWGRYYNIDPKTYYNGS